MPRFNPDTYPDRLSFDAYARALRREELDRLVVLARKRLALALRSARRLLASDSNSHAPDTSSGAA